MNQQPQTFNISLVRSNTSEAWGFRLQGGIDFKTPLSVQTVNPGGVAERCGLQPSDAVLSIEGNACECMEHEEAKRYLIMAGNQVNLVVQRGALKVWKPKVTPLSELRGSAPQQNYVGNSGETLVQRTSLAADKQEPLRVGSSFNTSAKPFAGFGGPSSVSVGGGAGFGGPGNQGVQPGGPAYGDQQVHGASQYGGYQQGQGQPGYGPGGQGYGGQQNYGASASSSEPSTTGESNSQSSLHAPVNIPGYRSVSPSFLNKNKDETPASDSAAGGGAGGAALPSGMRSVKAPVFDPSRVQQQIQNHPVCKACNSQIIGVFVKIRGDPLHPACFKCFTCEKNLKNQGYYEYDGHMYCDSHGPASVQ